MLPDPDGKEVLSVACSRDYPTVATGDENGKVYVWDVYTGKVTKTLPDPSGSQINSVVFSPDDKALAAGDHSGEVFLWHIVQHS